MPGTHLRYSPSGANRWGNCNASLQFDDPEDDGASQYADEGTAAHELAEICYYTGEDPYSYLGKEVEGFTINEEMAESVKLYLDTIEAVKREVRAKPTECYVELFMTSKQHPDFGGTADFVIAADSRVVIVDFKYGVGVPVKAEGNKQLMCYTLLALANFYFQKQVKLLDDPILIVVQPRSWDHSDKVKRWEPTKEELEAFAKELDGHLTNPDLNQYQAGDHCQWCPGKAKCKVLHESTKEVSIIEPPETTALSTGAYSMDDVVNILNVRDQVKYHVSAVEVFARNALHKGVKVPGYKLVKTFKNRQWKDPSAVEAELQQLGIERSKSHVEVVKLISPAKMEKVVDKEFVDRHAFRPPGNIAMVPDSDKRPAFEVESATDVFKNNPENPDSPKIESKSNE